MKKKITIFLAVLIFALYGSLAVSASEIIPADVDTASEGCIMIGISGKYITDIQNALNRINEIRYEACVEGVPDPNYPSRPLTTADYTEIKWSSDLEYIARLRAAEASITVAHKRLNGKNCFSIHGPNSVSSFGEVLAWNWSNSMIYGIEQWYEEKEDWVNPSDPSAVTGHYEALINPRNRSVGLATFCSDAGPFYNTTAGEFSYYTGLDERQGSPVDDCIQLIEASASGLIFSISDKTSAVAGESSSLSLDISYLSSYGASNSLMLMEPVTWNSSDTSVAAVDENGTVTATGCGTAEISAAAGGKTTSTEFTVNHTPVNDSAVAPTCTKTGLTEGSHCSVCGTVIKAQEIIPTTDHTPITDSAVAPACTKTGLTEGSHCSVCGITIVAQNIVPAAGHREVVDRYLAPACIEPGLTQGSHCSVCGTVIKAREIIPATGHTPVTDNAVEPSCTEPGLTQGSHCSVCGITLIAQNTVPATGHTEVTDKAVSPTCTETGLTQGIHCSVCNAIVVPQTTVPATGHSSVTDGAVAASCTEDGQTGRTYCAVCGETLNESETIPAKGHNWDSGKTTKSSTAVSNGEITYTCLSCDEKRVNLTAKLTIPKGAAYTVNGLKYEVTNARTDGNGTVSLTGTATKKSKFKTLTVPAVVNISGASFKVTAVSSKAFKGYTRLSSVTIGKNVTSIGKEAFYGCTALTKTTIGSGVTKISERAFMGCKKLKTLTIKSSRLKSVGTNAIKNIKSSANIRVPSKKVSSYKKLFKSKTGYVSTMKIRK